MATATHISLADFHASYATESGYEYWFGEVVRKGMPTWLHAILQAVLCAVFDEHGYIAGTELDLRISSVFQPRPDVAATLHLETYGYPTKPIDIVAEVLSPDDRPEKVAEKCGYYAGLGIQQIYVFDPVRQTAEQWNSLDQKLQTISELTLTNGALVQVSDIFARLDERIQRNAD